MYYYVASRQLQKVKLLERSSNLIFYAAFNVHPLIAMR